MVNEDLYIDFVQQTANQQGKVFMLESGEGRDYTDPRTGWYIEDLSGWLITAEEKEAFLKARENNRVYDDFGDCYVFVKWAVDFEGNISIIFKYIP